MMITIPVLLPIVIELGYDPVWFGILFMVEEQMDYLTPPFGFTLFYMKGVAPPEVSMGDIYNSILPFIAIQFVVMLVILFSSNNAMASQFNFRTALAGNTLLMKVIRYMAIA